MMPHAHKMLLVDIDSCVRCHACEIACRQEHGLSAETGPSWCRVVTIGPRRLDRRLHLDFLPVLCLHCDEPLCRAFCPSGVIHKDEEGRVLIDQERCTGCGLCVQGCPYGCISFNEQSRTAGHCDLCRERTEAGREPACVQHCIGGALQYVAREELAERTSGLHTVSSSTVCYASGKWRLHDCL